MADVITRFKIETTQFDSKLRDASKELADIGKKAAEAGKGFDGFTKESLDAAKALGNISTSANNAKGKVQELVGAYNDVARAYDKLTQDQKQSDFGKAMAGSLQQLQVRIREAKQELYGLDDAAKKVSSGGLFSGDKLSGMLQVFGGNLMTKGAMMIGNFAAEMGDMVKQGIEMAKAGEGIRIAFERLGRGDLLDGLREATHGTVTDLELMKAAVKFNDFKLPVEELGTMLAFAQQKAKDTGQSVDYMVDSIVTGLGRKSLMILDNLGLSAAEIKEKMAQTGDMTKAVGEIIREQMSKAGNYIETAADQATQADVRLKNAMTDLGNTLTPLSNDFGNFWNELKIGGLNFLNEVLSPIVSKMTQAGQIASAKNRMGGNEEIANQLNTLSGSSTKQITMLSQLAKYDQQIKDLQAASNKVVVPGTGQGTQYAINQINAYKTQIQALLQMREEYQKRAMEIIAPNVTTTTIEVDADTDPAVEKLSDLKAKLKELRAMRDKSLNEGDFASRDDYNAQIKEVQNRIKELQGTLKVKVEPEEGSIDYLTQYIKGLKDKFNATTVQGERDALRQDIAYAERILEQMNGKLPNGTLFGKSESLSERLGLSSYDYGKKNMKLPETKVTTPSVSEDDMPGLEKLNETMSKFNGGVGSIVAGLKSIGIDLGEDVNRVLSAISGVTQIISGVSSVIELFSTSSQTANTIALTANTTAIAALTAAVSTNTITSFLPFFAGGGVVRAANGFEVPGNHFSGDMVPALLNSGEVVLNRAQVGVLGSSLQQQASQNRQVLVTKVKGTDLLVMLDQTGKLTGKGELMFWR